MIFTPFPIASTKHWFVIQRLFLATLFISLSASISAVGQTSQRTINRTISKLKKLDQKLEKPQPGEWLAGHPEKGQTFSQYKKIRPNVLTRNRNVLYIQPLGELTASEQKIVEAANEYLSAYFQCKVKELPPLDLDLIPASARRSFPTEHDEQLLTSFILEKVLAPRLPDDGFATLAFTNRDLWPGDGWNFVFGYAAFRDRVGVWSLHRFGDPEGDEQAFRKCLLRTIKLATHETGHMFSIAHCTHGRCNMQGSNSLVESDTQPLHLCSQCQAKILYGTGADPNKRFRALRDLCAKHGFDEEVRHYDKVLELLK